MEAPVDKIPGNNVAPIPLVSTSSSEIRKISAYFTTD